MQAPSKQGDSGKVALPSIGNALASILTNADAAAKAESADSQTGVATDTAKAGTEGGSCLRSRQGSSGLVLPTAKDTVADGSGGILLPTYADVQRRQRVAAATTEAERTGYGLDIDKKTVETVARLEKTTGREVVFFDDANQNINGYTQDGKIYINKNGKQPVVTTFSHELTHNLEQTKAYERLKSHIFTKLQSEGYF